MHDGLVEVSKCCSEIRRCRELLSLKNSQSNTFQRLKTVLQQLDVFVHVHFKAWSYSIITPHVHTIYFTMILESTSQKCNRRMKDQNVGKKTQPDMFESSKATTMNQIVSIFHFRKGYIHPTEERIKISSPQVSTFPDIIDISVTNAAGLDRQASCVRPDIHSSVPKCFLFPRPRILA